MKNMYLSVVRLLFTLLLIFTTTMAIASAPQTISYQGFLSSSVGTPLNATVTMNLKIYDVPTGGSSLWSETQAGVVVADGVYGVVAGTVTPLNLPFDKTYYLGVAVNGDPEMTPRQTLTSVPYAIKALKADTLSAVCAEGQILKYTQSSNVWSCSNLLAGPTGPVGATGPQGPIGPQGTTGLTGQQGVQGPIGATGPQGIKGDTGAGGAQGIQGIQGVKGDTGAAGATGATGPIGPQGPIGLTGSNGANGANGVDGKNVLNGTVDPTTEGVTGDFYINTASNKIFGPKTGSDWTGIVGVPLVGPQGSIGATGPQGIKGDTGATGATGSQGPIGLTGPQGVQGPIGATGPQGIKGDAGAAGAAGATGPIGPQGPTGLTGSNGANGVNGTNGTNGADGKTVLSGSDDPVTAAAAGSIGDFYIDTASNKIYGPKTGTDWSGIVGVPLVGPQGPAGATGPEGATGLTGPQGVQGLIGATGPQGIKGDTGAAGAQGIQGIQGVKGDTGAAGATGATGPIGPQGPTGLTGSNGANGANGEDGKTLLSGIADPTTEGVPGDFYINTSSNKLFGPKTGTDWTEIVGVALVGPQGPAGATGSEGPIGLTGPQGLKGDTGAAGAQGIQGIQGVKGDTGAQGIQGLTGATGPAGATGATGPQGSQGIQGLTGATGAAGPQGPGAFTGSVSGGNTSIGTRTCTELAGVTVTGATTTMAVVVSPSASPNANLIWSGRVSAANTVIVRVCNITNNAITPTNVTYSIRVIQ